MQAPAAAAPALPFPGTARSWRPAGDERLALAVGRGQESAVATIYRRYHQPLYRYCRSLLGDDADAQDALQSTFANALVALREQRRDAPLRPWLYRIAHNESVTLLRRRRPAHELTDELPARQDAPHDVVEQRAELAVLMADLRDLPERQRGALVMRELEGLPHEEIAAALGMSVGSTKQSVLEARRSLQEFADGRAMACAEIERLISDGDRRTLRGRRVRAHLRGCAPCSAFAAAIAQRRSQLQELALSPVAASGIWARISSGAGGGGGAAGGGGASLTAGTGKGIGLALSAKAVTTGAAVVVAAAAGSVAVLHHSSPAHPDASRPAMVGSTAAATPATGTAAATARASALPGGGAASAGSPLGARLPSRGSAGRGRAAVRQARPVSRNSGPGGAATSARSPAGGVAAARVGSPGGSGGTFSGPHGRSGPARGDHRGGSQGAPHSPTGSHPARSRGSAPAGPTHLDHPHPAHGGGQSVGSGSPASGNSSGPGGHGNPPGSGAVAPTAGVPPVASGRGQATAPGQLRPK